MSGGAEGKSSGIRESSGKIKKAKGTSICNQTGKRVRLSRKVKTEPIIVIDTREQHPYRFKNSITKALKSGDYSILGLEDKVAIERKTKEDAYGSSGAGRKRFERELIRLSKFDYSAIVIESDLADFLEPPGYTKMNPLAVINSFVSWNVKYRINVFFASDRKHARALVQCILQKYWKHKGGRG